MPLEKSFVAATAFCTLGLEGGSFTRSFFVKAPVRRRSLSSLLRPQQPSQHCQPHSKEVVGVRGGAPTLLTQASEARGGQTNKATRSRECRQRNREQMHRNNLSNTPKYPRLSVFFFSAHTQNEKCRGVTGKDAHAEASRKQTTTTPLPNSTGVKALRVS